MSKASGGSAALPTCEDWQSELRRQTVRCRLYLVSRLADSTWVPPWLLAVGAAYCPWILGMAGHLSGTGAAVPMALFGPGLLVAMPLSSTLGNGPTLCLAGALTFGLILLARKLLEGRGYGFLAYFAVLTIASLWLGRLMSM